MISICVPSYNSLDYLKILVSSLKRNTKVKYELLIHDNGSTDGTADWLRENCVNESIMYSRSVENLGFCGVNKVLKKARHPYTMIFNADMYALPGWDTEILKEINKLKSSDVKKFSLSCCLIEPLGNNSEYTISYHGHDAKTFDENSLLNFFMSCGRSHVKEDTIQYSHPILMPTSLWKEMGHLDESYFPGWAVDHDLAINAYKHGCRVFKMLGRSRVYHFISKTFSQLPSEIKNKDGQDIFLSKWGMSVNDWRKKINVATEFKELPDALI